MVSVATDVLDAVLALQLSVAWAGEGRSEPARLGWWDTDLVDVAGGGDLLARLLPQTHAWGGLEAVREAARRVDQERRQGMGAPDSVRTLFFLGFELDEQLHDRLSGLKRGKKAPEEALRMLLPLGEAFSREAFASALEGCRLPNASALPDPAGRQVRGPRPEDPAEVVKRLAFALLPLEGKYPMPFFKVKD